MEVKVKGLEEIKKKLKDMEEGLTLHGLQHWAKEIESEAKGRATAQSSQEVTDSIQIDIEETEPKTFQVRARAKKEALPIIVDATKVKLFEMPSTSGSVFKAFLGEIEKKSKKI